MKENILNGKEKRAYMKQPMHRKVLGGAALLVATLLVEVCAYATWGANQLQHFSGAQQSGRADVVEFFGGEAEIS